MTVGTTGKGAAERSGAAVSMPAPRDAWQEVIAASRGATVFGTPEWIDACCEVTGLENATRLYTDPEGRRVVMPAVRRAGGPRGLTTTWSMPDGWGIAGALAEGAVRQTDVATVLGAAPSGRAARLVVKPGPLAADAWRQVPARERVAHTMHVIDLRPGHDALWSNVFSTNTRNKIRKAERRGVEVRWGAGEELLEDFWTLYLSWSRSRAEERGLPARVGVALAKRRESLERFRTIARHLGDRFRVVVGYADGQPVAATIALFWGPYAHYWRSTSDQALNGRLYANYLVIARLIEHAVERGHEWLDMGESGGVPSLISFKEKFGAKPYVHDELRFEPRVTAAAARARTRLVTRATDAGLAAAGRIRR